MELIEIFEKYCEEHNDDILSEHHSGREIARKAFWAGVKAAQQGMQSDGWKTCGICGAVSNNPCPHHAEQG